MRTCPKVRGIAAHSCHCVRLCPRNGEATAGLTELTIIYSNNMYWYAYTTDTCITIKIHQRTQINGFKFSYIRKV